MPPVTDGMPATLLRSVTWTKSSYSNPNGNCVELARLARGTIAVRDSRYPGGPILILSQVGIAPFVAAVQAGKFAAMAS